MIKVVLEMHIDPELYDNFELEDVVYQEVRDLMYTDLLSACDITCYCEGCEITRSGMPAGFCDNQIGVM